MEENKITIQQAYYGEVNRAHSCIIQTVNEPDLTSFLITFTDRPAALPPGVELTPYLSGVAFSKYYIFTKTFPDTFATRAGMVFTHTLILNLSDISLINNLDDVLFHFVDHVPKDKTELQTISIKSSNKIIVHNNEIQPQYIQQIISSFIKGPFPLLFSGNIESFRLALHYIWNSPNEGFRKKIKFRTSFTPSDIEGIKDLTIISIQKELLSKWSGQIIIQSENNNLVEITSRSEALFLGNVDNNPFYSFLLELNVNQSDFQNFGQCDKIYTDYADLDKIEDANILRQNIRLLSKVSPSAKDGREIKEKFIQRLEELIVAEKDTNLKALRNIDWMAFYNGEKRIKQILSNFLNSILTREVIPNTEIISELLSISFDDEKKNWWHDSIHEIFKSLFTNYTKTVFKNIWELIDHSEKTLKNIFALLPISEKNESYLQENIPINIREETAQALELILKKRKWYLLHADVLLKHLILEKALLKQIEIERPQGHQPPAGVIYISEKLVEKKLLALTLSNSNKQLIQLVVKRISKNKSLLNSIDVNIPCWLDIWSLSLARTKNITYGIEGKEKVIIYSIFDLLISEKEIPDIIIELISDSPFADISNYPDRKKLWNHIPEKFIENYLGITSKELLNQLLSNAISLDSIEKIVADKITSDSFINDFFYNHTGSIEEVIKLYEAFSDLSDEFLSVYLSNYNDKINDIQSARLGTLVRENVYKKTAKIIYDKSKYNYSFKIAFEHCKDLVRVSTSWWDLFMNSTAVDLPKHKVQPSFTQKGNLNQNKPNCILVITATDKETTALLGEAKRFFSSDPDPSIKGGHAVKFLGTLNSYQIWHGQCEAGSGGPSGAQAVATDLIDSLNPKYVLMPGIAFGLNKEEQKIGDILVSTHVYTYEKQRAGDKKIPRADKVPSSSTLLSTLRMVKQSWKKADMHFGVVMSGEKLVDNPDLVEELKKMEPEAIGGEMEGAGIYSAAHRRKVDWIIFKSIVDWGTGKTNEHQGGSSSLASEVLFEAIKILTK